MYYWTNLSVEPVDIDTPSVIKLIDEILKCSEEQPTQDTHMEVDGEDSEEESLLAPSAGGKKCTVQQGHGRPAWRVSRATE